MTKTETDTPDHSFDKNNHSLEGLGLGNQRFTTKSEIKPWLKKYLWIKKGINIVIERSDSTKIIFKCKTPKKDGKNGKLIGHSRKSRVCPFKIRANYSLRNSLWTLVVINDQHNHKLEPVCDNGVKLGEFRNDRIIINDDKHIENSAIGSKTNNDTYGSLTDLNSSGEIPHVVKYHVEIDKAEIVNTEKDKRPKKNRKELRSNEELMSLNPKIHFNMDLKSNMNMNMSSSSSSKMNLNLKSKRNSNSAMRSNANPKSNMNLNMNLNKFQSLIRQEQDKFQEQDQNQGQIQNHNHNHNYNDTIRYLKSEVHSLLDKNITQNKHYSDNDKAIMLKLFISSFVDEFKDQLLGKHCIDTGEDEVRVQTQAQTQAETSNVNQNEDQSQTHNKAGINTWLTSPSTPNYAQLNINTGSNTNLIPLSPLLNDVEAEYQDSNSANVSHTIDTFTHLPGINLNSTLQSNAIIATNQISSIQNHVQQLPSFNFIQNQLPASPNSINATTSLFGNNNLGMSSLIPPISNTNSMTLNPSHLLKSSKNPVSNLNQSTSLNEFKINNSSSSSSTFNNGTVITSSLNSNHNLSAHAGLSSPNNNIINHASSAFSNMAINYKDTNTVISTQGNNSTTGGLHGINNLGDTL